ncbi:MAG: class I adenylate-forming enzyme family protein [Clostridiales bacterium]
MLLKEILIKNQNNNKVAIYHEDKSITYKELFLRSNKLSNELKLLTKQNIAIFTSNSIEYAISYFSITMANKIIVPINPKCKDQEINTELKYCDIGLIITTSHYIQMLKDIVIDKDITILNISMFDKNFDFKSLRTNGIKEEVLCDDTAIMLHTSGSTSNPKRVMLSHKNLISNLRSNIDSLELTKDEKTLITLPMFFGYCNTSQFLTSIYLGAQIIIMNGMFKSNLFMEFVKRDKITNTTLVPHMLIMLLDYIKNSEKTFENLSLRYICFGGSKMPIEKLKQIMDILPSIEFIHTYGQTEASPRITALLAKDSKRKIGSIGKVIPRVSLRIVNGFNEDVKSGEVGEIIVSGDNIMKGYYNKKAETDKVIRNGWLYTGDLGKYDSEGYLYITGRKKNLIISGSYNIYPEEIEEFLMNIHYIKNALVFGIKDDLYGELIHAKIVLKKEYSGKINKKDLMKYMVKNLMINKVPCDVEFVESLDKTLNGKVKRYI